MRGSVEAALDRDIGEITPSLLSKEKDTTVSEMTAHLTLMEEKNEQEDKDDGGDVDQEEKLEQGEKEIGEKGEKKKEEEGLVKYYPQQEDDVEDEEMVKLPQEDMTRNDEQNTSERKLIYKEYPEQCKWEYDESKGGYPAVALMGQGGEGEGSSMAIREYVCPSMFRDLSDYVYGWPYAHFKENIVVYDANAVADHLPPVSKYLVEMITRIHVLFSHLLSHIPWSPSP